MRGTYDCAKSRRCAVSLYGAGVYKDRKRPACLAVGHHSEFLVKTCHQMKRSEKAIILIVDDKPANILALDGLLSNSDRIIMNAYSGEEALKIALEQKIDLIILDVQMPNMDGFEVAQILKSNKKTKDIPIIFASAEKKEHA